MENNRIFLTQLEDSGGGSGFWGKEAWEELSLKCLLSWVGFSWMTFTWISVEQRLELWASLVWGSEVHVWQWGCKCWKGPARRRSKLRGEDRDPGNGLVDSMLGGGRWEFVGQASKEEAGKEGMVSQRSHRQKPHQCQMSNRLVWWRLKRGYWARNYSISYNF